MAAMAKALKSWNFKPIRTGLRLNIDRTAIVVEGLERRLEIAHERNDGKVAIVGWIRGATLGKAWTRPPGRSNSAIHTWHRQ